MTTMAAKPALYAAVHYRPGRPGDALCVGMLATHVFLDTYAAKGMRPDLAREALSVCSTDAFVARLADPTLCFVLAEIGGWLIAFAEVALQSPCPIPGSATVEVVRLYVHPKFHGRGIGKSLSGHAQRIAARHGAEAIWLSAWSGNTRALGFYRSQGYQDIGVATHVIEGTGYENRVLLKVVAKG